MFFNKGKNELAPLIEKERIPVVKLLLLGFLPSKLKVLCYRVMGLNIQWDTKIGFGSVIDCREAFFFKKVKIGHFVILRSNELVIGAHSSISSFCFLDTKKIVIGSDTRIRENVMVGGLQTPDSSLTIGDRCIVMQSSFLNTTKAIEIGDDSGVGGYSLIFTHASWLSKLDGYPVVFAPVKIGKSVWLPWRIFIMPGVSIGDRVVVSANSVITTSVPSNCLVAGNPVKVVVENYPRNINDTRKEKYLVEILEDFSEHLLDKGFTVDKKEDYGNISFTYVFDSRNYLLTWYKNPLYDVAKISNDNISLISHPGTSNITPRKGVILDLEHKCRIGSDLFGEIFIRFLSRYGIRFKRRD